jgi:adenylate cyclase
VSAAESRAAIRTVGGTIVFTDLVGFTEFTALRGDEAALDLLSLQERLIRREIRARGRIVKKLGDGLMLWFNDPCYAVEAALALQDRFEQQSPQLELPLWVRIGVHHGRPARHGRDLVGHDVNLASRIVDLAGPGEVLASEATVQRIGSGLPHVAFEEVGPVVMKGIPSPVLLYRAVRQG